MNKARNLLLIAIACLMACFLCTSCTPSAADQARDLIKSGDLDEAIEKASTISDQTEKQAVYKEIVIDAMDAQQLSDMATAALSDVETLVKSYSSSAKSKLYSAAISAYAGGNGSVSLEVDTNDSSYKAAVEQGKKIRTFYDDYMKTVSPNVQNELDADTKAADEKFRSPCSTLASFTSQTGLQTFLYSSDVLGSSVGASKASVTPDTLKTKMSEFKAAYDTCEKSIEK